ncbi:MAG: sulfite exporter TauE/SafE family protein [candidate division Zixibacteria bacterium]|nr:sulfite exporter TauE/SafE family protein [Candidatus Tariuqbacter arcticus]
MTFPVSGIETYWWLPLTVAFAISILASLGGLSGAFLILPFQVSVLGFTGPGVSPTNLVFNIVAIPAGVYRYWREGRMVWPLAWATIIGTLPGVFIGAIIRIRYLPDPKAFKLFVGSVLLYIGVRLIMGIINSAENSARKPQGDEPFEVSEQRFNLKRISYRFQGEYFSASTWGLLLLSFIVGIVGGTYGIGGGAIIAPFLVTVFRLPIHTVAGASLLGTFITSVAGVLFYTAIAPFYADTGLTIQPDWLLGAMFGIGGAAGIYIGARVQRFVPARVIKSVLAVCIMIVVVKYVSEFIR